MSRRLDRRHRWEYRLHVEERPFRHWMYYWGIAYWPVIRCRACGKEVYA